MKIRTVGIAGSESFLTKLESLLHAEGFQTIELEKLVVQELPYELEVNCLDSSCILAFTSANGVRMFFKNHDLPPLVRTAVIGSSTGKALKSFGIEADICPTLFAGEALAEELIKKASLMDRIILFRSALGDPKLYNRLKNAGLMVEDVHAYTVIPDVKTIQNAEKSLANIDYIAFGSAGGVRQFILDYDAVPMDATCVCIGEPTANELRKHFNGRILVAPEISAEGIASAIQND